MKLYTTYGTYNYLHQIQLNHTDRNLLIFSGDDQSILMEETTKETIFQQPNHYRVLSRSGELSSNDFLATISIPTTDDHKYQLEKKLESYLPILSDFKGYHSFRLLKSMKSNVYKIAFGFDSRLSYEEFKKSSSFRNHFSKEAVRSLAGASSVHASYLEKYFYSIVEEDSVNQIEN
ncbi:signal transduction protein TRAP [Staphylococcus felis]|uniref:Signal transduction protein TRAP n=2 Tax=Staphylococcus felis TaxID=46127 RepID=A0AAQ0HQU5_9STAP|nr:signal transduction protein TRAP [Staphylococcus felis]AVP37376.1 signal transduction protein TRAP [Staphylococcus felis]MBH9580175.1 signal transduction protein TRAP [Staphylococcus felis]PNZ35113.1 signal transduction protein TRAP [Staphylococcus felis]QQB02677.1 signal transduction protein TRAP [Staphylococcus felis]REH76917.1 signal transduction protein TRAP [Staphylococcus felis]